METENKEQNQRTDQTEKVAVKYATPCPVCYGDRQDQTVCPWCGYDSLKNEMVSNYVFLLPKPDSISPDWPLKRKLHILKAIIIIIITLALSVVCIYAGVFILLFISLLKYMILITAAYGGVFLLLFSATGLFMAKLITAWGKSNTGGWGVLTMSIITIPTSLLSVYSVMSSFAGIWSYFLVFAIIGVAGYAIMLTSNMIQSRLFCNKCGKLMFVINKTVSIHSSFTAELIKAFSENPDPEICAKFNTPKASPIAETVIKLHKCKKCAKGVLEVTQNRMYIKDLKKLSDTPQGTTTSQVAAYFPVENLLYNDWSEKLDPIQKKKET